MSVAGISSDKEWSPPVFTEKDYYVGQKIADNEYRRSKFEAEGLVLEAVEKGLNARVFRVGTLTGRYSDGKFQLHPEKNAFANRLKSFLSIAAVPESMLSQSVEMTPVDLCAKAIVGICASQTAKNLIYHIYNTSQIPAEMCIRDSLCTLSCFLMM